MNTLRKIIGVLGLACCLVATSLAAEPPAAKDPASTPNSATLARGKYLVTLGGVPRLSHAETHDRKKAPRWIQSGFFRVPFFGEDSRRSGGCHRSEVLGGLFTNDLTGWAGPWGISFASNLTPDRETGMGAWTEKAFIKTLRTGKTPGGRPILPPMPWESIQQASDKDLKAMFAYLMSLPPVRNMVPAPAPPK